MEKRISDLDSGRYDYIDGDLFMMKTTDRLPDELQNEVLDMELLLFCRSGWMSFSLDQTTVHVAAGQCALCPDFRPIRNLMVSPDLRLSIIGFSWHLLEDIPMLVKQAWTATPTILRQPFFTPDEGQRQRIEKYLQLLQHHVDSPAEMLRKEMIHLLFQTLVLDMIGMTLHQRAADAPEMGHENVSQATLITRQFFEILTYSDGAIRSVSQVAQAMNITPKYLSHVISSETNHPPLYHIHKYTARAIERQLSYSDRTIKEIATRMGFPSLAFFGKFVKEHLGASPKAYRARRASLADEK